MTQYSLQNVKDFVSAAVEKMGADFVYNPVRGGPCFYTVWDVQARGYSVPEDDPKRKSGCIVGAALSPVLSHSQLEEMNRYGGFINAWNNLPWLYVMFDAESARYLRDAQKQQDQGKSWGQAVEMAEENLAGRVAAASGPV